MELIVRKSRQYHVSHDTVEELESSILQDSRVAAAQMNGAMAALLSTGSRILERAGLNSARLFGPGSARRPDESGDYFAVMMELDSSRVAPWFAKAARKSVYVFDAWPSKHAEIRRFTESWGVQYAFVSSSQAATALESVSERTTFLWVPEGVDPTRYQRRSFLERDIDVLQLGRKYDAHHTLIAPALARAGKTYAYEKSKGDIVFPGRTDFVSGLARSRVSICVPSSITHPERAGNIDTLTTRYLQSMASGCLVVGRAPAEMIELFGYNPVVEIDMHEPADQILAILADYASWLPLIEKNFDAVARDHTWARRWERMASVLFAS